VGLHVSLRSCVTGAWLRAVGGTTAALTRLANKRKPYVGRIAPIRRTKTPETRNPPMKAGRCPGKAGEYQGLSNLIFPENSIRRKPIFGLGGALSEIVRALRRDLIPNGEAMLAEQFAAAAAAARTTAAIDEIARLTWRAHAEGHIPDPEAGAISEALEARRAALVGKGPAKLRPRLLEGVAKSIVGSNPLSSTSNPGVLRTASSVEGLDISWGRRETFCMAAVSPM
jgi:hypothetical protein